MQVEVLTTMRFSAGDPLGRSVDELYPLAPLLSYNDPDREYRMQTHFTRQVSSSQFHKVLGSMVE